MNQRDGVEYKFHHLGLPTTKVQPNERYSELFRMYTSDSCCEHVRTQWHRFEADSTIHPLIRTLPHVAFQVGNLDRAVEGCDVILGPYEPLPGLRVAMIDDGGHPVEFLETALTDVELATLASTNENLLYGSRFICQEADELSGDDAQED
jgi:hypothetical protein